MKTLKFGFRDSKILFNKRAIVSVDKLFEIIKEAEKEKIKMYMISYAYEGKMYSIGYDKIEKKQYCNIQIKNQTLQEKWENEE